MPDIEDFTGKNSEIYENLHFSGASAERDWAASVMRESREGDSRGGGGEGEGRFNQ